MSQLLLVLEAFGLKIEKLKNTLSRPDGTTIDNQSIDGKY